MIQGSRFLNFYHLQEVTKFINAANETKAATKAAKEGAQLRLIKAPEGVAKAPSAKRPDRKLSKK